MPIYGYKKAVVDEEYGLLELREISLEFSPEGLRRVARLWGPTGSLLILD
jgi:hypothetical protein